MNERAGYSWECLGEKDRPSCRHHDTYTGICCNPDCPARADVCPATDYMEICKYREETQHEDDR